MSENTQVLLMQEKLESHIGDFVKHCKAEDERWSRWVKAQEHNTESIKELTESTRDLLSVWQAANGTVKTMAAFGRFIKWLGGLTVIGALLKWIFD